MTAGDVDHIFSFAPDKERANDLLSALEEHERKKEEAEAKRRLLARIVDRLENPRDRAVATKELHDLLNDIKRLFSEEEQYEDEELAAQIMRVQQVYNDLRQAEGEIVARANLGQHSQALNKLDELMNQGITQLPRQDGRLIDIGVRRRNIVNDYRRFVHNKIAQKREIADNEWLPAYPVQALSLLEECKALYEALVQDVGDSTVEDRQLEADLDLYIQRVQLQVDSQLKAKALVQKANQERSVRKQVAYLKQAESEYDHFPNIKKLIARAEERLANQMAAEIENHLKKIEREAQLTTDFNKMARFRTQVDQLYQKGIADGVTSSALQDALQKREAVQNYLMARVDFLQRVKEIHGALQQQPPALWLIQQKVQELMMRYPEEAYPLFWSEIKQLERAINRVQDEQQKLLAARQALELGDPDEVLKILQEVRRDDATPLLQQARIALAFRRAAEARQPGLFDQARTLYDEIERLPNLDPQIKTQVQKERSQTKIEEQNHAHLQRKVKLARQFWERGNRARACQELKEAINMAGAGPEIRDLLDHYIEEWRLKVLEVFTEWLVEGDQRGLQEMQTLVEQARHNQLLLNDRDYRLANEVYLKCRRIWALETPIRGSQEQMKAQLKQLEDVVLEVPDLAKELRYLYRLAQLSLQLAQYDRAKEYVRRCFRLLEARAFNPKSVQSPFQSPSLAEIDHLRQEIVISTEINQLCLRIQQEWDRRNKIDDFLIRELRQIQAQMSRLQAPNPILQNLVDELIERMVVELIQRGREKHQNGLTVEVLYDYYWAWRVLNPENKNGPKSKHDRPRARFQFIAAEVKAILYDCFSEITRLIQILLAKIEQFEARLRSTAQKMGVQEALEEVKILKKQADTLHDVLKLVDNKQVRADQWQVADKRYQLIEVEWDLTTLAQKINAMMKDYQAALQRGDFRTERLFGPIEEQLKQLIAAGNSSHIQLKEVDDLSTCLYNDIGLQVFLPLRRDTLYNRDEVIQEDQVMLPTLGGVWPVYQMRTARIGDIPLHRALVKLIQLLQIAWLDEEFEWFERVYRQMLVKIDEADRYALQRALDLYESSYQTDQTKYKNLEEAYRQVLKKIKNLQAWEEVKTLRTRQHTKIRQEWEKIRDQTRPSILSDSTLMTQVWLTDLDFDDEEPSTSDLFEPEAFELPTIERRKGLIGGLQRQVAAIFNIFNNDSVKEGPSSLPEEVLSEKAAKYKEVAEEAETALKRYSHLLAERTQQLDQALERRNQLLDKLHYQIEMKDDERVESILQELEMIDPNHPTVRVMIESGGYTLEEADYSLWDQIKVALFG